MPSSRFLDAVAKHAVNNPDRPALISGNSEITYGQLHELAAKYRDQLPDPGSTDKQSMCVPAQNNIETIALLIACFDAGHSTLVPSPALGHHALRTICAQARCSQILITRPDGLLDSTTVPENDGHESTGINPGHANLLLTTSGSTGIPKIVPIPNSSFDRFADWATRQFGLDDGEVALSFAPLNFDLSLLEVWVFLLLGARVVLADAAQSIDGRAVRELVREQHVTFVQGVPLLYRLLAEDGYLSSAVNTAIFTGDALPHGLLRRLPETFPNAKLFNIFGCTETNDSFIYQVTATTTETKLPIGRPVEGVRAVLIDDNGRTIDGPGTGELLVSTPFQTTGYLQPRLTEKAFVHRADGVYYRTGDLVTRDSNGLYTLEGRLDFQVKIRGIRTNIEEVEAVLSSHPDVDEAAVVALPDATDGCRLHARIRRRNGSRLSSLRLRSYSAELLPRHAIPATVRVTDEPLPRTATGKPDRNSIIQEESEGEK